MKALPVIGVISSRKIGLICLSRHFRNRLARWVFRRSERWSAHIDSHGESGWNPQCSTVCRSRPARLQGKQISSACCRCKRSPGIGWGCRWNSPTVKEDPGGTAHREPPPWPCRQMQQVEPMRPSPKRWLESVLWSNRFYFALFKQNKQHQHKLIPMNGNFDEASFCHEMNRCKEPT